jgi:multisubunit Na+/H+ antiporter MnhE subunit
MAFWLWIIVAALILIVVIEPLRKTVFGKPGELMYQWGWWFLKQIIDAHLCVFKNLVKPHKLIYPTLESDKTTKRE